MSEYVNIYVKYDLNSIVKYC